MNRQPPRALALILSLVLMIFSVCQAQARATLPAGGGHLHAHDARATGHAHDTAPADCHGDCLHLSAHADPGQSVASPDASPGLLAWLPAMPAQAGVIHALAYLPPDAGTADPPAFLRFQRFLN